MSNKMEKFFDLGFLVSFSILLACFFAAVILLPLAAAYYGFTGESLVSEEIGGRILASLFGVGGFGLAGSILFEKLQEARRGYRL